MNRPSAGGDGGNDPTQAAGPAPDDGDVGEPEASAAAARRRQGRRLRLALLALLVLGQIPLWRSLTERWRPWSLPVQTLTVGPSTRHFYIYRPGSLGTATAATLVYLQGLDDPAGPSPHTRQVYRFLKGMADRHRFQLVLPRGHRGSFPEASGTLAWTPLNHLANRAFLDHLAHHLVASAGADPRRLVLGGFSNGAYFAGVEMALHPAAPWSGYWLEGGGYAYGVDPRCQGRRALVSVSRLDVDNCTYVEEFLTQLRSHGWREPEPLRVVWHGAGHDLDEAGFPAVAAHLLTPGPEPGLSPGATDLPARPARPGAGG